MIDPGGGLAFAQRWDRIYRPHAGLTWPLGRDPAEPVTVEAFRSELRIDLVEALVQVEPAHRRMTDLLCLTMVETGGSPVDRLLFGHGPESIRSRILPTASGLLVKDLDLGRIPAELGSVRVLVFRLTRGSRVDELAAGVADLLSLLDYPHDPAGSRAAARAALRQVEVLAATGGAEVVVAGSASRDRTTDPVTGLHLLVASGGPPVPGAAQLRTGRVTVRDAAGQAVAWRDADYVAVRLGPNPPAAPDRPRRDINELRRAHRLVPALAVGTESAALPRIGGRAAEARQVHLAQRIVSSVVDDRPRAVRDYRAALAEPADAVELGRQLTRGIRTLPDFWVIHDVLAEVENDVGLPADRHQRCRVVRDLVDQWLTDFLDVSASVEPGTDADPIGLDLDRGLHAQLAGKRSAGQSPIEARTDEFLARYLKRLVGEETDRWWAEVTAVARLPRGGYRILVKGVPVRSGTVQLGVRYRIAPVPAGTVRPWTELTDTHPLTGEVGLWSLSPSTDTDDGMLDATGYLAHQVAVTVCRHLARLLDMDDVDEMVPSRPLPWDSSPEDGGLPDVEVEAGDLLRLTRLLRSLLDDRLPIVDVDGILARVKEVGGLTLPLVDQRRAARGRLREHLPKPWPGVPIIPVPAADEVDLQNADPTARIDARHRFRRWLERIISDSGPAQSLVTRTHSGRDAVAAVVRRRHQFVLVLAEDEVPT